MLEHQRDPVRQPVDTLMLSKKSLTTKLLGEINEKTLLKSGLNKLKHVKCIESIQYSNFNPVTAQRQMQGDLFYLVVKTLENPN